MKRRARVWPGVHRPIHPDGKPAPSARNARRLARAAYRDDTLPERACHHCGKPYRGPAVYCSFECAVADA